MTNTVLIKRSGTANSIPVAGDLQPGELAINYNDGNLFYKNSAGAVTLLTSNQFVSVVGNVTGGNLNAVGLSLSGNVVSALNVTSNIAGGNLITVGRISATGTISTTGSTVGTGFAVGNGAVSNVALGFFPTAGTAGEYAIRDYSTVPTSIYFDVGMGGTAAGEFKFRTTNAYSTIMTANTVGLTVTANISGGNVSATGSVYGAELWSTNSVGSEGGQINLALPASGSTISGGVIIDVYNNLLRFYERSGTNRGAYIDLTAAATGVGSNLLAGGSSSTPTQIVNGTSNVVVASSGNVTVGVAGTAAVATFTTAGVTANSFNATNNGTGFNYKVGDDAWIGDINLADTVSIKGQQNAANAYITFGNNDGVQLGRAGAGPLTYNGAFSASGNITSGNIVTTGAVSAASISVTGNAIVGGDLVVNGNVSYLNIDSLNVEDPIIGLGRGANNAPLSSNDNKDRGTDLWYYSGIEKQAFVGYKNSTGKLFAATDVSISSEVVTVNSYGTFVVGTLEGATVSVTGNITGGNANIGGAVNVGTSLTVDGGVYGNVVTTQFAGLFATAAGPNPYSIVQVRSNDGTTGMGMQAYANLNGLLYSNSGITFQTGATIRDKDFPTGGATRVTIDSTGLLANGIVSASGNVTGNYIIGNGSQLTGLPASYSDANVVTLLSSFGSNTVSTTGNVTAGYFVGNGSTLASITGANVTGTVANATYAVSAGNATTATTALAGNVVTVSNNQEYRPLLATGSSGNLAFNASSGISWNPSTYGLTAGKILLGSGIGAQGVTGTYAFGGNTGWAVQSMNGTGTDAAGQEIGRFGSEYTTGASTFWNAYTAYYQGSGSTNGWQVLYGGATGIANISSTGMAVTGVISASGNVTGSNVVTAGAVSAALISASGNVTGGNISTGEVVTAVGNIIGGNINTAGIVSATGNVVGGNITTGAQVSATGNITGGNIVTSAVVSAASVSASGNVTGGNIVGTTAVVIPTVRNIAALTISTSAGDLNLQPTGNVVVNSKYINGVTNPVQDQDVATKIYVDNAVSTAISYHQPVTAATTTTLATTTGGTITYTQPNGAGNGVGALLTTTGAFNLIDTANVQTVGTRILVKNEANAVLNGVYTWANATNIVRSTDTNTYGAGNVSAIGLNDYFFTTSGNVNSGAAFVVSAPTGTITFGTSNIVFSTFSTSQTYTANTSAGVSLVGTVINAKVDGTTTAFDGTGNISVKASAVLTTPNVGAATGTSLSVSGNVTGGNINTAGVMSSTGNVTGGNILTVGLISSTGNITSGNSRVFGDATGANSAIFGPAGHTALPNAIVQLTGNSSIYSQVNTQNINSAGSSDFVVTANNGNDITYFIDMGMNGSTFSDANFTIFGANDGYLYTVGSSATAPGTAGNLVLGSTSGVVKVFVGNTVTANLITTTSTTGFAVAGIVSATGNITGGNILGGANVNATTHTGTTVSVTGNVTGAGHVGTIYTNSIINTGANLTGNIGSSTLYFNTAFVKATSAQYADLAEQYMADADYPPGTVLIFGGEQEVTANIASHSTAIAGVVSETPSYLMNAGLQGTHVVAVALLGRVPCQVQGTIRKGDLLVASNTAGVAQPLDRAQYLPGCVIGKALANYDSATVGTIEIAVGVK